MKLLIFSYLSVLTFVLGAQKHRLNETVLLSTHNIRFGRKIGKLIFDYALLSGGLINSGFEVIKLFPCSTQLSTKFILLINVKMPTIVGILTFISMINTTYERLKARNFFMCWYFSFYKQLKFRAPLS